MDNDGKISLKRQPMVIQIQGWYPIVITGFVMILLTVGNLWWTYQVDQKRAQAEGKAREAVVAAERKADQRWCKLMGLMNEAYNNSGTRPSTALGIALADAIEDIYISLNC